MTQHTPTATTYTINADMVALSAARLTFDAIDGQITITATETDPTSESYPGEEVLTCDLSSYLLIAEPGHVWVRDYSEHSGLPAALETAGIASTVRRTTIGPFKSPVAYMRINDQVEATGDPDTEAALVPQISQEEYDRLRVHQYAGTREELVYPENWTASHWILTSGPNGGATLQPVTISAN